MDGGLAASLEAEPEGLLAARLVEHAATAPAGVIYVARSESRAQRVHDAAAGLAPDASVLLLPAWDCLPFDRTSPSRQVMGQRMEVVHRLGEPDGTSVLVVASVDAVLQKLPPPATWTSLILRTGEPLDPDELARRLQRLGYALDDVADHPGEAAVRGAVVDIFPAAAAVPYRIEHVDGVITEIRAYDPTTQRSRDTVEALTLGPASELLPGPDDPDIEYRPGIEHALAVHVPGLVSLFALMPKALLVFDPEVGERRAQRLEEIRDGFESLTAAAQAADRAVSPPAELYLDEAGWQAAREGRGLVEVAAVDGEPASALPPLSLASLAGFLREQARWGTRVGLAGPARARRTLLRAIGRRLGGALPELPGWLALRDAAPGTVALLTGALDEGFAADGVLVIAPGDVLGAAVQRSSSRGVAAFETVLAPGDAVIHIDHGMAALRGVETVEQADCLRLGYAGNTGLLVTADEIGRIWRYGAEAGSVTLDRLNTETWAKRRAAIERDIAATANRLVALARERDEATAPVMRAGRAEYDRFVNRFPFNTTPDQAEAIAAIQRDLAAGRPMDRLICGDVGYGKTEIALRAAAIATLAGWQVALVAPTTVLVRQHLQTFRRRFAGLGIKVAGLSRLSKAAEARAVRAGLADGSINLVIGTQTLAGKGVQFARLGLLIIDEEQRFGVRQKTALRALRDGVHVLTLTATPIPRTLQAALAGLQQLSVLTTPPARRQPVRTVLLEFDPVTVTQALRREARRGGQSFVVCPRIEDLAPMRDRLADLVPELELVVVHGAMTPDAMDEAMVRFADGRGDALLSTNIIEAGLDVPRANTMLIWHADRFGLAQLHQLRGRVGRGRVRGAVYLLTEPGVELAPDTAKRLDALVSLDRLGAGFAISARDLDLRGAGDLLGEDQAGHVKLIGVDLYRHMLRAALRTAHGEPPEEDWTPEITLDLPAFLPADYVHDATLRVSLHARLAEAVRSGDAAAIDRIEEEIADRFGPLPDPVHGLLAVARLQAACRRLGVASLDAGPEGAAVALRGELPETPPAPLERRGERLVLAQPSRTPAERIGVAEDLLDFLEP